MPPGPVNLLLRETLIFLLREQEQWTTIAPAEVMPSASESLLQAYEYRCLSGGLQ